jgi:hypothetical protein
MYVYELVPGMVHELDMLNKRSVGTVICTAAHPIFPGFFLVVWKMDDGQMHFDALMPAQVLPSTWIGQTPDEMNAAWKKAVGLK